MGKRYKCSRYILYVIINNMFMKLKDINLFYIFFYFHNIFLYSYDISGGYFMDYRIVVDAGH